VNIVGVSFDQPSANATFKSNEEFEFPLWSDTKKTLALYYGGADASWQFFANRVTVILDDAGNLVLFYPVDVVAAKSLYIHAQTVLDDLAQLLPAP
jgi:peroxiredoxin